MLISPKPVSIVHVATRRALVKAQEKSLLLDHNSVFSPSASFKLQRQKASSEGEKGL